MSGHTPGPWEALPIRWDERGFRVREIRHASPERVGGVHAEVHELAVGGLALQRLDADAALIATAPELLEAAREALHALGDYDTANVLDQHARRQLRAAIAKAEGSK